MTPDALAVIDNTLDLLIQIYDFQEIDSEIIENYYPSLIPRCTWLYLSNPVGKYLPNIIMTLRRSQFLVDPWDEETLEPKRSSHVDAYHPDGFLLLAPRHGRLRPFYQHVIYESVRNESTHTFNIQNLRLNH